MVYWYSKGQSQYTEGNFHMAYYIDINGYDKANYNSQDIEGDGESGDPFMAFGIDTQTWVYGQGQVEIGLLESHRIRINSSGIYKWVGPNPEDFEVIGGGIGGNLDDLDDVVITTPVDNELLTWNDGSSKWINQTAAEAGLAVSGHNHAHNSLAGLNDGVDFEHITQTQKDALHAIYTLEQHNNAYHDPDYKVDFSENTAFNKDFGNLGTEVCVGNDARLSDDRDPKAHILATIGPHSGTLPWGDLNKTGSNLTDIPTRNHNDLLNLNAGDAYEHITQAQKDALHPEAHDIASHSDTTATGAELETLTDGSDASTLHLHKLDTIANPSGDKEFNFANKHLHFKWVAPASGAHEGAFEIEASGAFSGDLIHIHQHTGNVGANTYMVYIECEDVDASCLHLKHAGAELDFGDGGLKLSADARITEFDSDVNLGGGNTKVPTDLAVLTKIGADITTHEANPGDINHLTDAQVAALHAKYTDNEAVAAIEADDTIYTKAEVDGLLHPQAHTLASHSTKAHNELSDAPANAHHVAFVQGDADALYSVLAHLHDGRYYTETELNNGQLDNRYFTETEINANTYTRAQVDAHNWLEADITDLDKYTQTQVDDKDVAVGDRFDEQSSTFPVSPSEGDFHYDEDDDSLYRYNAEAGKWVEVGGGGSVGTFVEPIVGYSLNAPERSRSSGGYALVKETTLTIDINRVNVSWEHKTSNASFLGKTRVYVNGVAVSGEYNIWSENYSKNTYTLTNLKSGDDVQIYAYNVSHTTYVKNFIIGDIGTINASY